MNDRTLHTLIAALRFWQLHEGQHPSPLVDVASNDGEVEPLSSKEIDDLIQNYLNASGVDQVYCLSANREGIGVGTPTYGGRSNLMHIARGPFRSSPTATILCCRANAYSILDLGLQRVIKLLEIRLRANAQRKHILIFPPYRFA